MYSQSKEALWRRGCATADNGWKTEVDAIPKRGWILKPLKLLEKMFPGYRCLVSTSLVVIAIVMGSTAATAQAPSRAAASSIRGASTWWTAEAAARERAAAVLSLQEEAPSASRTILFSAIGAAAGGALMIVNSFGESDHNPFAHAAGVTAGAGFGAVLGSASSGRRPAHGFTLLGAGAGGLGLLLVSATNQSGSAFLFSMALPVFGAVIGNSLGQAY